MWDMLLSGGLSLISSLGSRFAAQSQASKQRKIDAYVNATNKAIGESIIRNWGTPQSVVADAEAGGFNPVTWLQAGGLQGMTQARLTGMQMQSPQMSSAPMIPSLLSAVGDAGSAMFKTYREDSRLLASQDFQREMFTRQQAAYAWNRGRPLGVAAPSAASQTFFGSGNIPYAVTAGRSFVGGLPMKATDTPLGLSDVKSDDVKISDPWQTGFGVSPVTPNANSVADRVGDEHPITWGYGWKVAGDDLSWNIFGRPMSGAMRQGWRTLFGYPTYPDGARGLSWGREAQGPSPWSIWNDPDSVGNRSKAASPPWPLNYSPGGPPNPLKAWGGMGAY